MNSEQTDNEACLGCCRQKVEVARTRVKGVKGNICFLKCVRAVLKAGKDYAMIVIMW